MDNDYLCYYMYILSINYWFARTGDLLLIIKNSYLDTKATKNLRRISKKYFSHDQWPKEQIYTLYILSDSKIPRVNADETPIWR